MKKLYLATLLLFVVQMANAQKIHWLLFIDTDDYTVGEVDKYSRTVLKDHFVNVVNSVLSQEGYETPIYDYYGSSVNSQNAKNVLTSFQCGPKDVVVFYYIGHGGRNSEETSQWPMLWMGEPAEHPERMISLEWVHNALKRKNPRFLITIGMCCNVKDSGIPLASSQNSYANYGNTYLNNAAQEAIKKMFLQNTGDILATSASKGESSGCVYLKNGKEIDTYTHCFTTQFEAFTNNGKSDWNSFFSTLTETVREISNNYSPTHHTPQFRANVTAAAQPSQPRRQEPEDVQPEDAANRVLNAIASNFDFVTDSRSNTIGTRQAKLNEIAMVFDSNAKVKVYSQDGNFNMDTEPVDVYLRRISTSGLLMKVVPFDYNASGGKITALKVKEYYKQR